MSEIEAAYKRGRIAGLLEAADLLYSEGHRHTLCSISEAVGEEADARAIREHAKRVSDAVVTGTEDRIRGVVE